jgi:hypothetical protein
MKGEKMISAEKIQEIFFKCLLTEEEIDKNGKPLIEVIKVEGIINSFGFHPERVEEHKDEIISFLEELPDNFKSSKGGGWSFLNACMDKDGNQWGEHQNMEQLFSLGIAIGKAKFLMPREMWSVMPGGVPYLVYIDN